MNKIRRFLVWIFIAAVILLGARLVLRSRVMRHPLPDGHPVHSHREIYYCPMHPTYTSDRPGSCPICSMKLVRR